jgi:hypothetical protein
VERIGVKRIRKFIYIAVILAGAITAVLVLSSNFSQPKQGRMSALVSILYSTPEAKEWLAKPKKAYIEAHFMFPPDLAEDTLFGLDLEFWEDNTDKQNYVYRPATAWMATAFISRDGLLIINSNGGEEYSQSYAVIYMNITLKPNVWYKLYEELDFGRRKYLVFGVQGQGIETSVNLEQYDICISNESLAGTFAGPSLTFYTGAVKISKKEGGNIVYSDNVEARIETSKGYLVVFKDGFENQDKLNNWDFNQDGKIDQKDAEVASLTENWQEGIWYKEHPTSLTSIIILEDTHVCRHDASPFKSGEKRFGR